MNTRIWQAFLLIGALVAISDRALAQATGSIHGMVRDASGAVITGAQVRAT
jgi:hypothetical protein